MKAIDAYIQDASYDGYIMLAERRVELLCVSSHRSPHAFSIWY